MLLLNLGAAVAGRQSLCLGAEHLISTGLFVIGHSGKVVDPLAAAVAIAPDQASTFTQWQLGNAALALGVSGGYASMLRLAKVAREHESGSPDAHPFRKVATSLRS